MVMVGLARETFMNYEFIYWSDTGLANLLRILKDYKRTELVKGEISVIPCKARDNAKGCVFATIRCDAVDSLKYNLREHNACDHEIETTADDYITIDSDPF